MHSRTVCARGGLWWSSGWGNWRSPPHSYNSSYPAYWQISTQLLSAGPEEEDREQWDHDPGNQLPLLKRLKWCHFCVGSFPWDVLWCYLVSQHPVELFFRDGQPLSVCAVHHQNDELQRRRQKLKRITAGGHGGPNGYCKFYANNPFSMQDSDPGWQKTKGWIIRERCERCGLSQTTQKKHRMIPMSIITNLHIWQSLGERRLLKHSERFQIAPLVHWCKRGTQATHTRADNLWIKKGTSGRTTAETVFQIQRTTWSSCLYWPLT